MDIELIGTFNVNILRAGRSVFRQAFQNGIVANGKNNLLDIMFGVTAKSSWYCGLINSISTLSDLDTMLVHTGWTEYTNYDEATRETWTPGVSADKNIINTTMMEFTINDITSPTLDGMFICSDNTKGGTAGVLWSTASFTSPPTAIADGDVIQVQYSLTVK